MAAYPSIGLPTRSSGGSSRGRTTTPTTSPITAATSRPGTAAVVVTAMAREGSTGRATLAGCGIQPAGWPGWPPGGGPGCGPGWPGWAYGGCWPGCPQGCWPRAVPAVVGRTAAAAAPAGAGEPADPTAADPAVVGRTVVAEAGPEAGRTAAAGPAAHRDSDPAAGSARTGWAAGRSCSWRQPIRATDPEAVSPAGSSRRSRTSPTGLPRTSPGAARRRRSPCRARPGRRNRRSDSRGWGRTPPNCRTTTRSRSGSHR